MSAMTNARVRSQSTRPANAMSGFSSEVDLIRRYSRSSKSPGAAGGMGVPYLPRTQTAYNAYAAPQSAGYNPYSKGGMYSGSGNHGRRHTTMMHSQTPNDMSKPSGSLHKKRPSNLISNGTLSRWNASDVTSTANEMQSAMLSMMNNMNATQNRETKVLEDIKSEKKSNKNFCDPKYSEKWTCSEVCYWLASLHLQKYVMPFHNQSIDGSILLNDLDMNMLMNELGIKRLHIKKVLRELKKLKDAKIPDEKDATIAKLQAEIATLKEENEELKKELDEYKSKT